jgi:hypothetical protein
MGLTIESGVSCNTSNSYLQVAEKEYSIGDIITFLHMQTKDQNLRFQGVWKIAHLCEDAGVRRSPTAAVVRAGALQRRTPAA